MLACPPGQAGQAGGRGLALQIDGVECSACDTTVFELVNKHCTRFLLTNKVTKLGWRFERLTAACNVFLRLCSCIIQRWKRNPSPKRVNFSARYLWRSRRVCSKDIFRGSS
jgi:hypothetical protein